MSADVPPGESQARRPISPADVQLPPAPPPIPTASLSPPEPLTAGPSPDAIERIRRPSAVTKLAILLRCHQVAEKARRRRAWASFGKTAALVLLAVALGALAGLGAYVAVYDNPEQYTQRYFDPNMYVYTYYVKGVTATQQQYDYFLATNSNFTEALSAAIVTGLAVPVVLLGLLRLRGRRPEVPADGGVEEQIAAIARDHAEAVRAWGGPSVLRVPELVAEVLRIEEKGGR